MIHSAIWGLGFWSLLAGAGFCILGAIEGVALWRVFFLAGYAGFILGLVVQAEKTELETELEEEKAT